MRAALHPARAISVANDGVVTFARYRRATMLLKARQMGVTETAVTIFGTYGRPIHRTEQLLGHERLQLSTGGSSIVFRHGQG